MIKNLLKQIYGINYKCYLSNRCFSKVILSCVTMSMFLILIWARSTHYDEVHEHTSTLLQLILVIKHGIKKVWRTKGT